MPAAPTASEYLAGFAEHVVHELRQVLHIKAVANNTDLLGAYAEASIRRIIRSVVHPMHVSRGGILDFPEPDKLMQLDAIVWMPFPAPGIFVVEDFALVPRSSAFGALEVKSSNYSGVDDKLEQFTASAPQLVAQGRQDDDPSMAVVGVVGVIEKPSKRLNDLRDNHKVVAIFEKSGGEVKVCAVDVLRLINVLHRITWRYRTHAAGPPLLLTT